jgi:hypothetical protein
MVTALDGLLMNNANQELWSKLFNVSPQQAKFNGSPIERWKIELDLTIPFHEWWGIWKCSKTSGSPSCATSAFPPSFSSLSPLTTLFVAFLLALRRGKAMWSYLLGRELFLWAVIAQRPSPGLRPVEVVSRHVRSGICMLAGFGYFTSAVLKLSSHVGHAFGRCVKTI